MGFDIIHDAEKKISALIDPEVGRALGPIALGEDGVKVLKSFAGIHGVDPSQLPVHTIEARWEQFVKDITDIEGIVEDGAHELETAAHPGQGAPADHSDTAGEKAPPSQAEIDAAAASEHAATHSGIEPSQAPSGQAQADADLPLPAVPGAGQVLCPTCDGFRTVVENGVEKPCPTCQGAGVVAAHQDRQAQGGAAA